MRHVCRSRECFGILCSRHFAIPRSTKIAGRGLRNIGILRGEIQNMRLRSSKLFGSVAAAGLIPKPTTFTRRLQRSIDPGSVRAVVATATLHVFARANQKRPATGVGCGSSRGGLEVKTWTLNLGGSMSSAIIGGELLKCSSKCGQIQRGETPRPWDTGLACRNISKTGTSTRTAECEDPLMSS
jgi:hypothetical protein